MSAWNPRFNRPVLSFTQNGNNCFTREGGEIYHFVFTSNIVNLKVFYLKYEERNGIHLFVFIYSLILTVRNYTKWQIRP